MKGMNMKFLVVVFAVIMAVARARAGEAWVEALQKMPSPTNAFALHKSGPVDLFWKAFQSNSVVKGVVFLPAATDELYFFNRGIAKLAAQNPNLWDAVQALTNRTKTFVTFRNPYLLIHGERDFLEPAISVKSKATAEALKSGEPMSLVLVDADWKNFSPDLAKPFQKKVLPRKDSPDSWHFYRFNVLAAGATPWELIEMLALAGKTKVQIASRSVTFAVDADSHNPPARRE